MEKKKMASDIKLVFHSSTIKMMHGPINIRFWQGSSIDNYHKRLYSNLSVCYTIPFASVY